MNPEAVRGLARTAREFALRHVSPVIEADGKDGALEQLPSVLDEAEAVGLMASPDRDSPGHEYGVWGTACLEDGPMASLAILDEISRVCAGVACCLHSAGLGALELAGSHITAHRVVSALFEEGWSIDSKDTNQPPANFTRVESGADGFVVTGTKNFVPGICDWDGCVVYCRGENGWQRVYVHRDRAGVFVKNHGRRLGLAAVELVELRCDEILVAADARLEPRPPWDLLKRHLLGLGAAAVGNARGALAAARTYAEERYQGGDQIETHPAVQGLLGDAASRVAACRALLIQAAEEDGDDVGALNRAAAVKLRLTVDCCQAVTDCLQVFGGYGYMEDYGLEKRLRDAMTLKSMWPGLAVLRRMAAAADLGGGW